MPRRDWLLLLPCLLLLTVTVPHLDQGDFRRDTGRYAAVGLHMWSGGDLLTPYLNPETPYFNKPPLALWIHGLSLKILGPNLVGARLPSIVAALGVVFLSVLTVRRMGSRAEAIVSGCVLALSIEFFRRTREISLDLWQLVFLMLAVYMVVRGGREGRPLWVALSGVPLGLALLCKPLAALAILPVMCLWLVWFGRGQYTLLLVGATVPLATLVALPWHLYMYFNFGEPFVARYLMHEVVDRAKGLVQTNSPWYYLSALGTRYWPWLAFVGYAIWKQTFGPRRKPNRNLVVLGGSWTLFVLVMLSLFPDRKPNYALPLYPMLSWVAAAGLCRLPWHALRCWYRRGFRWLAPAAAAALLIASVLPLRVQEPADPDWSALFQWLDQNPERASRLAYSDLEANDLCYYYIKRGVWLPNSAGLPEAQPVFLLARAGKDLSITNSALFISGKLVVKPGLAQ